MHWKVSSHPPQSSHCTAIDEGNILFWAKMGFPCHGIPHLRAAGHPLLGPWPMVNQENFIPELHITPGLDASSYQDNSALGTERNGHHSYMTNSRDEQLLK